VSILKRVLGIYIARSLLSSFAQSSKLLSLFTHRASTPDRSFPFHTPAFFEQATMLLKSYLAVLTTIVMVTSALPLAKPPKLSVNTNVQATGPPTPNENWPKTITDGELRQKNPDESPTTLSGPQIGPSANYNPGQAHTNTPVEERSAEPAKPKLSLNTHVQATGPPTPNDNWPKTITDGELRQKNPDESPTTLSGPQIGPSANYNPGQAHTNTPVEEH
jgi:hypothetical protein